MDYAVVIGAVVSSDGIAARVTQVRSGDLGDWTLRSARCHLRLSNWYGKPRLGEAVAYMLGQEHPLFISRRGNRVTIYEVDVEGVIMVDEGDQVIIPMERTQTLHEAILSGLDGRIGSGALTGRYRLRT